MDFDLSVQLENYSFYSHISIGCCHRSTILLAHFRSGKTIPRFSSRHLNHFHSLHMPVEFWDEPYISAKYFLVYHPNCIDFLVLHLELPLRDESLSFCLPESKQLQILPDYINGLSLLHLKRLLLLQNYTLQMFRQQFFQVQKAYHSIYRISEYKIPDRPHHRLPADNLSSPAIPKFYRSHFYQSG